MSSIMIGFTELRSVTITNVSSIMADPPMGSDDWSAGPMSDQELTRSRLGLF